MSVTFAIGGMETSVGILWMVAAFSAYLAERTRLAAFFAALAVLTRPDTLIWVGPLALEVLVRALRERRFPWAEAAWLVVPVAPWILFATLTFGGVAPGADSYETEHCSRSSPRIRCVPVLADIGPVVLQPR